MKKDMNQENAISLLDNCIRLNKNCIDAAFKQTFKPYSNTDTVHYKIIILRNNIEKPFEINYGEDKELRDFEFKLI